MNSHVSDYRFTDLEEGSTFTFSVDVASEDLDKFAQLSGDVSPLHMDSDFAKDRGFESRIAHGVLLAGYISRLVGVHFPGRNALLQTMNLKFLDPVYPETRIRVRGVIKQISTATNVMVLSVYLECVQTGRIHVRGTVQIGFTAGRNDGE
jgi:3-hydroxybutyryl-CoA dehydratase